MELDEKFQNIFCSMFGTCHQSWAAKFPSGKVPVSLFISNVRLTPSSPGLVGSFQNGKPTQENQIIKKEKERKKKEYFENVVCVALSLSV